MGNEHWQCPNCGGYKVKNLGDGTTTKRRDTFLILLLFALFTYGLSLLFLPIFFFQKEGKAREDGSIEYSCNICGYNWFHVPGQPWPEVDMKPNLIIKSISEEKRR